MKLYNGDCLIEMKKIPDHTVDLILTDLPYGYTDCPWDKRIDIEELWKEWKRVLKPAGIVALFGDNGLFTSDLIQSNRDWFKYNWIWKKSIAVGFLNAKKQPLRNVESVSIFYGNSVMDNYFKSKVHENKLKYLKEELSKSGKSEKEINQHFKTSKVHWFSECQFSLIKEDKYKELQKFTGYFKKSYQELLDLDSVDIQKENRDFIYNPQMTEGKPYKRRDDKNPCRPGVYSYKRRTSKEDNKGTRYPTLILEFKHDKDKLHPTQKPVSLLEYLVKTYTDEGMTVLDCTMGVGSTGVACLNTKREFIGIEMDKDYFDIAKNRLNYKEE